MCKIRYSPLFYIKLCFLVVYANCVDKTRDILIKAIAQILSYG